MKLFRNLRILTVSLVRRILKPSAIQVNSDGVFLSQLDFEKLLAVIKNPEEYLPLNSVDYGASFAIHLGKTNIPYEVLTEVRRRCVNIYLFFVKNF